MGLIGWMRKLGILRYGTKKYTYTSGKDMPAEALLDDVYDAKKDLMIDGDNKNPAEKMQEKSKKGVSMWKKILGTIVVIIGLFVGLVMWATSGMSETANEFFILVKTKNYDDAYNMLSEDFKKSTSEEEFETFLKKSALVNYKEASWDSRQIEGDTGILEGSIITKNGEKIPLVIKFIKDTDGNWAIYSLHKPASGIVKKNDLSHDDRTITTQKATFAKGTFPTEETLKKLISQDVARFTQSINEKNMKNFYDHTSTLWKKQTTVEELNKAYSSLFRSGVDFTVLNDIEPIIDGEPVMKDGILNINFHYPTSPTKVYFKIGYSEEDDKWLVSGLFMETK